MQSCAMPHTQSHTHLHARMHTHVPARMHIHTHTSHTQQHPQMRNGPAHACCTTAGAALFSLICAGAAPFSLMGAFQAAQLASGGPAGFAHEREVDDSAVSYSSGDEVLAPRSEGSTSSPRLPYRRSSLDSPSRALYAGEHACPLCTWGWVGAHACELF